MSSHVIPPRVYYTVYAAAIAMLIVNVAVVETVPLGNFELPFECTIAVAKTFLIVMFFMHVRYANPITRLFAVAAVLWLIFLIGLTMTDVGTRPSLREAGPPAMMQRGE